MIERFVPDGIVGKKYRLGREIGRGGASVVYEADDIRTQRRVALKLIAPTLADDERARRRFLREARNAAQLAHPHVVSIYEADCDPSGLVYIACELLVGEDLETRLAREGRLGLLAARDVLVPVMSALEAAHAVGIVHRDVKPSNVFLAQDRSRVTSKLIDFGLSKPIDDDLRVTRGGMLVGTPGYMAPEQVFEAEVVGPPTDIWQVATVWFECLSGRLPYVASSVGALARLLVSEDPPSLREVDPSIPEVLAEVIDRGLRRDRAERWPSMLDFILAIEAAYDELRAASRAMGAATVEVELEGVPIGDRDTVAPPRASALTRSDW